MLSFLIVGDDVLGVPFIKISLRFARAVGDACPYKICGSFDILSVGHDILGVPSIKISFCLKGPSRTPVPTGFGENFDVLLVGEDIILPPFIKIALRFERTCTWQAASFLRKHCGRPYKRKR